MSAPLTLGTAGHIDHGKTALVKALTGVDTDRLPEERERGISIALGYAALDLPGGRRLSVVDVPGHERFVRTMAAGATGIDLFLMVVAADDGVMPQTREHAEVLRALGVARGVVAITKTDLADPARATEEAAELLPGAPAIGVSARAGTGLEELRAALADVAAALPGRPAADTAVRLHVDRAFSIHGAGTVVTGTLWSGTIGRGDELTILPSGRRARVRGVQVHDARVDRAQPGQRVAVNLTGVDRDEVARGDVLSSGALGATFRLEARLDCDPPPRVTVHHGTRETPARTVRLADDLFQLRLDAPLVADTGDRVVIRSIAPPDTLGGGVVTDPSPPRRSTTAVPGTDSAEGTAAQSQKRVVPGTAPVELTAAARAGLAVLEDAGAEPPLDAELGLAAADFAALRDLGHVVRLGDGMHVATAALDVVRARILALFEERERVTLADVRDALHTSRKYAQAYLERLDAERLTLRTGDARVLRRRR